MKCSRALAKAWKSFQQKLPPDQREVLHDTPPSLSSLFNAVKAGANKWQADRDGSKWGKTKAVFTRLARSADDHSQLLAVVPNNDKYISLLTGSLSAITNATVRHDELAIALSESLEQLCEDIAYWREQVLVHAKVPEMQEYVRELYVVIFEFLTDIFTKWSASGLSRFARAFDKNAADKLFKSKQDRIDRLTKKLDRAARLDTEARIAAISDQLSKIERGVSAEDMERLFVKLGNNVQRMLQEQDFYLRPELQVPPGKRIEFEQTKSALDVKETDELVELDILAAIPNLEDLLTLSLKSMNSFAGRASHLRVEKRVIAKLRDWISEDDLKYLWIEGPAHVPKPSQNTLTAVAMIAALGDSHPTISCFCDSMDGDPGKILRLMIDSFIAQTASLLPLRVSCPNDLSTERIRESMEPRAPVSDRLSLLSDLQQLVRRPVFYIIDCLQAVEDRSDRSHSDDLQEFLQLLCAKSGGTKSPKVVDKVCFTTDGYADALARQVDLADIEKITFDVECDELATEDESFGL